MDRAGGAGDLEPHQLRLQRDPDQRRAGQVELVRGRQPVSAPRRPRAQPGQFGEGFCAAGKGCAAGRHQCAGQGRQHSGDAGGSQRSRRVPEVPGRTGRTQQCTVAVAGRDRELSAAQIRRAVSRPDGATGRHRKPHHGGAQSLYQGGAGLQRHDPLVPVQPDGDGVRVQGEAEFLGRERKGNLDRAEGGFQSNACAGKIENSSITRAPMSKFVFEDAANVCELRSRCAGLAAAMNAARASLLALMLCWAFAAFADVAVPPLSGRVVDQTGTLSRADLVSLTQTLKNLEMRKGSQVAVLIVPTTAPETIEQYSIRVAEAWKIGRKKIDDGALLVVAKDDRKLRIEVGYGLEGSLNDVTAKRIIDEVITPKFRSGDFAGGISAGVKRIIGVIEGEPLPAPAPAARRQLDSDSALDPLNPFLIIPVLLFGGLMRSMLGRLIGSVATGGLVTLVAWYFVGSVLAAALAGVIASIFVMVSEATPSPATGGRGRGGGWIAGGSGGSSWSGGSSSDSGRFSGGGGSFGGGGASGSW